MFKNSVRISGECFKLFETAIEVFESLVNNIMMQENYKATITSANDGDHSEHSLHYIDKAIDIRIKDIHFINDDQYKQKFLEGIVLRMALVCPKMVLILHLYDGKQHLHIQHGRDNIISFDNAIGENKNVFIK